MIYQSNQDLDYDPRIALIFMKDNFYYVYHSHSID